jgi:hypothetical protein
MEDGRMFTCGLCGRTVWICKRCDRGHRYCSKTCSKAAGDVSKAKARRKFQSTDHGREGNTRRQREYYYRHRGSLPKNLTDHTSPAPHASSRIASPTTAVIGESKRQIPDEPEKTQAQSRALPVGLMPCQHGSSLPGDAPRCTFCGRLVRVL